eukprot:COSAG01_NODE_16594_length_1222_cov_10.996438_2_plen_90_part_00
MLDMHASSRYLLIRNYRTVQDIEQRACSQPNPQWIGCSAPQERPSGRIKIAAAAAVGGERPPPLHLPYPLPPDGLGAAESTLLRPPLRI